MTYNVNGPTVQKAMFELAEEYGAAVWDVYDIMGGKNSVIKWRDAGLIKSDRLHFTPEGYVLLGDLLYNAIVEDYNTHRD
jgi:lysophospholipase L1-like esterase